MNEREQREPIRWEEPEKRAVGRRTATPALAPALAAVIDSSVVGIVLVGASAEVIWFNRAFEAMTGPEAPFRIRSGWLHLQSRSDDVEFQEALAAVCRGRCPMGVLSFHRRSGSAHTTIQMAIVPMATAEVAAAIYVVEPFLSVPDQTLLRRLHGLTRMEARLAVELLQGASVARAAQSLGMSLGTARTHLKALFAKTHTSRQSDLVRLLGNGLARRNFRSDAPEEIQ